MLTTCHSTRLNSVITNEENFHARIQLLRTLLKLSQQNFSHWLRRIYLIDVSRETINLWESNRLPTKSFRKLFFTLIDKEIENVAGTHEYL
jgi:DNA-binding transcriptional regulator YiaG